MRWVDKRRGTRDVLWDATASMAHVAVIARRAAFGMVAMASVIGGLALTGRFFRSGAIESTPTMWILAAFLLVVLPGVSIAAWRIDRRVARYKRRLQQRASDEWSRDPIQLQAHTQQTVENEKDIDCETDQSVSAMCRSVQHAQSERNAMHAEAGERRRERVRSHGGRGSRRH